MRLIRWWRARREAAHKHWSVAYLEAKAAGRCTCVADGFAGFEQDPSCVQHGFPGGAGR